MNRTLLALPLMLLCSSSCQAQNGDAPPSPDSLRPGDIYIAGNGNEDGGSIGIEAPSNVDVEALYGYTVLSGNRLSAEKIFAVLIIVPPKGTAVLGTGTAFGWRQQWVFLGTHTLTQQLHPPHDYKSTKDRDLNYELDGRKKTVMIEKQTFDLTKGKYFVVTLDKAWKASSIQLKNDLKTAPLPPKTLAELRKLFSKANQTSNP